MEHTVPDNRTLTPVLTFATALQRAARFLDVTHVSAFNVEQQHAFFRCRSRSSTPTEECRVAVSESVGTPGAVLLSIGATRVEISSLADLDRVFPADPRVLSTIISYALRDVAASHNR